MRVLLCFFILLAATLTAVPRAAAQRASRPAAEWVKVLDAEDRLKGLRVADVVSALKLRTGDVVADLGAGSGPFVVPFASAVGPTGKVYAVEIDRNFFPYIEGRAKEAGVANVRTVAGEFTDPKLPAADVDVAFMHDVLHHIENRPLYFKNLARYLKPGARVVVIDYNPLQSPHRDEPALQVAKEQAAFWLADAGFKRVEDVTLFPDKYFIVFAR
jgi:ubiquinone/menaquinone biosynthesis C-methylase UbiE